MTKLYRITPLQKKSIEYFIDVYQCMPDGSIKGFDATFCYRWGQAFREEDNPPTKSEVENGRSVYADPQVGWGCEFDDLCGVYLNFTDGFTEEEQAEIEALCRGDKTDDEGRWGEAWIFDGDHEWEIEDDCVYVHNPVKIDVVNEDVYNEVIEENYQPQE